MPPARSRCGAAVPRVIAPVRMPTASPRPRLNHPASTFIATGYTAAMPAPLSARRGSAVTSSVARMANAAFATAASSAPPAMRRRAGMTSAAPVNATMSAPTTNPSCTATVSSAVSRRVICHSAAMSGATDAALNHGTSASSNAAARTASWGQRPRGSVAADDVTRRRVASCRRGTRLGAPPCHRRGARCSEAA